MSPSNAIASFGTLLKIGDGEVSETFTTLGEVFDLGGPELSRDAIDVTSHSSEEGWREYIAGLKEGGEISVGVNYIPTEATHRLSTGLLGDYVSGVKRNVQIVFPDGSNTTWTLPVLVTKFGPAMPLDDKLSVSITLKVAGKPTLA